MQSKLLLRFLLFFFIIFNLNFLNAALVSEENLKVTHIIDGDTIWVLSKNKTKKIRLIGIQAPEVNTNPPEPFSYEATNKLTQLIANNPVTILYDTNNKYDKYKRILAHVYIGNISEKNWVNAELIKQGLAYVYILNSKDIPYLSELIKFENQAIKSQKYYWSIKENLPISPEQTNDYLNDYKIVSGKIINISYTKNSIWLQMEQSQNKGFSIRIDINNVDTIAKIHNINNLLNKNILIRGFINKYSPLFGPFIELTNPLALEVK